MEASHKNFVIDITRLHESRFRYATNMVSTFAELFSQTRGQCPYQQWTTHSTTTLSSLTGPVVENVLRIMQLGLLTERCAIFHNMSKVLQKITPLRSFLFVLLRCPVGKRMRFVQSEYHCVHKHPNTALEPGLCHTVLPMNLSEYPVVRHCRLQKLDHTRRKASSAPKSHRAENRQILAQ